ncbi:MAG: EAL domain-containing protein [Thermoleophilia bacterium]
MGLATCLAAVTAPTVLVLSCDVPFAQEAMARLMAAPPGHAVAAGPDGRPQPLVARYEAGPLREVLERHIGEGRLSMMAVLDALPLNIVHCPAETLKNINTQDELDRASEAPPHPGAAAGSGPPASHVPTGPSHPMSDMPPETLTPMDAPVVGPAAEVARLLEVTEERMTAMRDAVERADRRLQSVIDALPIGIAVVAEDNRVLLANPVANALVPQCEPGGTLPFEGDTPITDGLSAIVRVANGTRRIEVRAQAVAWDDTVAFLVVIEEAEDMVTGRRLRRTGASAAPVTSPPVAALFAPVVDLASGRTAGVLATSADGGEVTGAALQRIIARAAGALAEWSNGKHASEQPFVMVSAPGAITDGGLPPFVEAVLRRAGAPRSRLWLRIPESEAAQGGEGTREALSALRRAGVRTALERFGGGASAMEALRTLPVDGVVLDEALIAGGDWAVIQTAMSVARHLGLVPFASGVADEAIAARLRALGCRNAEGPLYGDGVASKDAGMLLGRVLEI